MNFLWIFQANILTTFLDNKSSLGRQWGKKIKGHPKAPSNAGAMILLGHKDCSESPRGYHTGGFLFMLLLLLLLPLLMGTKGIHVANF